MKTAINILIILVLVSCDQKSCPESEWQIVFKNDAAGKKLLGDKETLIDVARLGYPIRIGIGGRRKTDTLKSM